MSEHELVLAEIPTGHIDPATTFKLQSLSSPPTSATPGHILLRTKVISVDPYLRERITRIPLHQPLSSFTIAEVTDSQHPSYSKGDLVLGKFPWRTVQLHDGTWEQGRGELIKLQPSGHLPLTAYVGVLGLPGWTAYFGILDDDVCRLRPGQTVLVSAAAGAVGSFAGQFARIKGAKRVIGTAGGPEKCRLVKERYGFDECLDYKALNTADSMAAAIKRAAPEGVDLFFDNTGGHVLVATFRNFKKFSRVALCGAISNYNKPAEQDIMSNVLNLTMVYNGYNVRGWVALDYMDRFPEFYTEVTPLVESGKIKFDETVLRGFEKAPEALAGLFTGANIGKMVVVLE